MWITCPRVSSMMLALCRSFTCEKKMQTAVVLRRHLIPHTTVVVEGLVEYLTHDAVRIKHKNPRFLPRPPVPTSGRHASKLRNRLYRVDFYAISYKVPRSSTLPQKLYTKATLTNAAFNTAPEQCSPECKLG